MGAWFLDTQYEVETCLYMFYFDVRSLACQLLHYVGVGFVSSKTFLTTVFK